MMNDAPDRVGILIDEDEQAVIIMMDHEQIVFSWEEFDRLVQMYLSVKKGAVHEQGH